MDPPPPVTVLRAHQSPITSVSFFGQSLFSTSNSQELFMWNLKTRRVEKVLHKHTPGDDGLLRCCADATRVVTNSRLGNILGYDLNGGEIFSVPTGTSGGFAGCRLQGNDIWFCDAFSGKAFIYDITAGSHFPTITISGHGMIMDISIQGNHVAFALEDSTVAVYDSRSPLEPFWTKSLGRSDPIISIVELSPSRCIVGGSEKSMFDVNQSSFDSFYEMPHAGVDDICVRRDGRIWCTAGWDGRVRMFDSRKRTPLAILKHHMGGVHSVDFSDDGLLASGGEDRGIALWSLYR